MPATVTAADLPSGILDYQVFVLELFAIQPRYVTQTLHSLGYPVTITDNSAILTASVRTAIEVDARSEFPAFLDHFEAYTGPQPL